MAKYKLVVFSGPTEGKEDAYNDWYQNTHLADVTSVPGIVRAQRFRHAADLGAGTGHKYLAIYEIETDNLEATLAGINESSDSGAMFISDTLDLDNIIATVFEEFGDPVGK
ncbi:MAG: hypothetical protein P8J20_08580 [Novosphingobium sp.]|nr:hypothetical protein [Novosphingobium sp.]